MVCMKAYRRWVQGGHNFRKGRDTAPALPKPNSNFSVFCVLCNVIFRTFALLHFCILLWEWANRMGRGIRVGTRHLD